MYTQTIKLKDNELPAKINVETGESTKGIITNSGLKDSFSYVFDWEILKK